MADVSDAAWWGAGIFGSVMVVWRAIRRWSRLGAELEQLRRDVNRLRYGPPGHELAKVDDKLSRVVAALGEVAHLERLRDVELAVATLRTLIQDHEGRLMSVEENQRVMSISLEEKRSNGSTGSARQ